eukprot:TRINITY_DN10649_c0_g1_i12.p2 TRINITY_DN10649_c0_g1~~TRINITY_DN10649_c0_g1_i12.p2  ORF type:complete len:495 (+),score=64.14 TRINITY_DN10649_c0_g1_i12:1857-3341(+)
MAGKSENTNNTSINEALFQACEAGDSELCQRLLEVGADANHLESGITPLVKAMSAGDCVQVEQPFTLPDGETALEWCMDLAEPWMAVVECLLAAGADVNQILEDEKTSLHVACELCIANAVVRLIAAGVDVNHRSQVGTPLIHHIVLTAQATMYILQTLLDAGADPNACDLRGQSALLCAISHDSRLVLEVLVAAGVDVNQTNKKGRTALHIACEVCSLDVVEFLISAGCDLQKRTDNGETPLQCACFQSDGSLHAYDCLIEAGARFEPKETDTFPWIIICEEQNLELVRRLAQWPAIMELPDENEEGALALHAASSSGSVAIVDFLLESGISVHQPDKSGSNSTPLMHAAHAACIETMQHLLEAGADVNQPNEAGFMLQTSHNQQCIPSDVSESSSNPLDLMQEGMTPIHFLARHPFWDPEGKALQLLLCAGADINACSKVGMTAIKYAIASSRLPENSEEKPSFIQYVTLLLEHGAEAIAVYGVRVIRKTIE